MNISTLLKSVAIVATLAISSVSFAAQIDVNSNENDPVSYTHLTLPTIYSV